MRNFTVQYPVAPMPWKPAIKALASSLLRPITSGRMRMDEEEDGGGCVGDDIRFAGPVGAQSLKFDSRSAPDSTRQPGEASMGVAQPSIGRDRRCRRRTLATDCKSITDNIAWHHPRFEPELDESRCM